MYRTLLNHAEDNVDDQNSDYEAAGSLIDGNALRSMELPTVRKGGYDTDAVARVLFDAAAVIDALHARIDANEEELQELHAKLDAGAASRSVTEEASALLVHAQEAYDATLADAYREAEQVRETARGELAAAEAEREAANTEREAAHNEAQQIVANARADAETQIGDLAAQIQQLQTQRDQEAAELDAQLEQFRSVAMEVHQRSTGALHAALAVLDGYVGGGTDAEDAEVSAEDEVADVSGSSDNVDEAADAEVAADDVAAQTEEVVVDPWATASNTSTTVNTWGVAESADVIDTTGEPASSDTGSVDDAADDTGDDDTTPTPPPPPTW